jgi:arsenate reductase-like glutaredoxin family protein
VAALLVAYPTLIKRPVLDNTNILAVGFNADHYQQLFAR